MEDHAVDIRNRTLTPLPASQWEELGSRVESTARAGVFRRPSSTPDLPATSTSSSVSHPSLLRRMSSSFAAAGAVSLGVQEWPTDWRTDWASRRAYAPSSPGSVSSVTSVSSASSAASAPLSTSAPAAAPKWPGKLTTASATSAVQTPAVVRRDSLHSNEQECVMDMVCLI